MKLNTKILSLLVASSISLSALSCTAFADVKVNDNFKANLEIQIDNSNLSENDKIANKDMVNNLNKYLRKSSNPLGKIKTKGGIFDTIYRAAATMKTEQIKINKIANEIQLKLNAPTYEDYGSTTQVTKPALSVFGIWSYIEHGTVHNDSNEVVHRQNLPLSILLYQEGYGNITGVSIDGVPLESALLSDKIKLEDNYSIDECCAQCIFLDEELISNLSDGYHYVVVQSTGLNTTLSDSFSFYLAD